MLAHAAFIPCGIGLVQRAVDLYKMKEPMGAEGINTMHTCAGRLEKSGGGY